MKTSFRLAAQDDFKEVVSLLEGSIERMRSQGIDQWDEIYPNAEYVQKDIDNNRAYVMLEDDKIVSSIVITEEQENAYLTAEGWKYNDGNIVCIRRLYVKPDLQNNGIGERTVKHAEEVIKGNGYASIRFDAFSNNKPLLRMVEKLGYENAGTVMFRKGPYYLFEKLI